MRTKRKNMEMEHRNGKCKKHISIIRVISVKNKRDCISYGEWFSKWMTVYKKNVVKTGTFQCYMDYYNCVISKCFSETKLCEITGEKLQMFYNGLAERDYSIGSIRIVSNILSTILRKAFEQGLISKNPSTDVCMPRAKQKKERNALTVYEQKLFTEYAKCSYLCNFFLFMLRTGLRNGEMRGLRWEDVDEENGIIHIRRTLKYSPSEGYYEDYPKSETSVRDIPITNDMLGILDGIVRTDGYVFTNTRGTALGRDTVQREMDRITSSIKSDGIKYNKITPHILRHTFATRAIEAGMEPQVLKTIMGHSSLAITMDIYDHVMIDQKKTEMEKISKAFKI